MGVISGRPRLLSVAVCLVVLVALACGSDPERVAEHLERGGTYREEKKWSEAIIEYKNVLKIEPNSADAHYGLAQAYLGKGDVRQAYWELRETVRLAPDNLESRLLYGQLARLAGELDEALVQAEAVVEGDPTLMPAHLLRAETLEVLKRLDEAQAAYEHAVELFPDEGAPLLLLANFHQRQEQRDAAEPYFRKLTEVKPTFGSYTAYAGFLAKDRTRDAETEEYYLKAKEVAPDEKRSLIHRVLASFYYSRGRFADSEAELEEALADDPQDLDVIYTMARFYAAQGQTERADRMIEEATKASPGEVRPYLVLSAYRGRKGDLQGALDAADAALEAHPDNAQAKLRKAELLLDMGYREKDKQKIAEGRAIAEAILSVKPSSPDALFVKAKTDLAEGKTDDAITALRRAVDLKADWAEAHYLLGSALFLKRDMNAARGELLRALEIDVHLVEARKVLARIHSVLGEDEQAVDAGREVLAANPGDVSMRILVAQSLVRMRKRTEALQMLKEIPADQQTGESLYAQGRIYVFEGNSAKAREYFLAADEQVPNHAEILQSLLKLDREEGRLDESVARIEAAASAEPENASLIRMRGVAYVLAGRGPDAEASFRRAIELDPNNLAAYQSLAQYLAVTGRREEVLRTYERAAAQRPDSAGLQLVLGSLYEAFGQISDAMKAYERGIELDPDLAPAKNNLAYLLADRDENLGRALDLAQEAKALLPESGHAADTLGWVLYKKGIPAAAIGYLKEAEGFFDPDDPNLGIVRHHLALAQEANGQPDQARLTLERALSDIDAMRVRIAERTGQEPTEPEWVSEMRAMLTRLEAESASAG